MKSYEDKKLSEHEELLFNSIKYLWQLHIDQEIRINYQSQNYNVLWKPVLYQRKKRKFDTLL